MLATHAMRDAGSLHRACGICQALQHMPEVKAALARIAMGESLDPLELSRRVLHSALPAAGPLAAVWAAAAARR